MSRARSDFQPWDPQEFLVWCESRTDERWELVDGFPLRMMSGATRRHDTIVVNILASLRGLLRGRPCRPFTADGAVQTRDDRIRRPDVGVDCGRTPPGALKASETRAVFEVLSPSTQDFDRVRKLAEYQALASIRHIVLVSQNEVLATHWFRGPDGAWIQEELRSIDDVIRLDAIGVELGLRLVFEDALD